MTNKIESPFVFGVRVEVDTFTDRRTETERLKGAPDKPCGEAVQMLTQKLVAKRYMIAKK
jgi:hypothetical protein